MKKSLTFLLLLGALSCSQTKPGHNPRQAAAAPNFSATGNLTVITGTNASLEPLIHPNKEALDVAPVPAAQPEAVKNVPTLTAAVVPSASGADQWPERAISWSRYGPRGAMTASL